MRLDSRVCTSVVLVLGFCVLLQARSEESRVADATMQGDRTAVRALLKQGADVNAAQGDGMTALHWAARQGDAELAQMLIYAGANLKATTRLGAYTPLLMAGELGHATVIDTLLAAGADPKVVTTSGTTPLMLASAAGNAAAVKSLLSRGADVNASETARGETALMFAVASHRIDAMKVLLGAGAQVNAASKVRDLTTQTNPEEDAFLAAQRQSQRQGAPAAAGEPAPGGGRPAPPDAAAADAGGGGRRGRGGPGVGAEAGVPGLTRQFRFAELVSAQGGLTPLLFAARHGYMDAAILLLESGADINKVSGDRTSPLLMATVNGHFDLAKLLLDRGADPRRASDNGVTPLYGALNVQWAPKALYPQPRAHLQQQITYLELLKAFIDKGVDVNARVKKKVWYSGYNFDLSGVDEIGATPFWRAAYASDVEAMRLSLIHI